MRPVSKVRSAVSSRGSTRAVRRTVHVLFLFLFVLLFVSRKSSRLVGVIYESTEVLSIDFHISPVRDVKDLLSRDPRLSHIRIIDKSLSGHCKMMHTCAVDLRVLNQGNGITLGTCPNQLKKEFWKEYKDYLLQNISAFVCQHALPLCEVYMSFPQPMMLIASTRYEIGRYDAASWNRLNINLHAITSRPGNVLAANNMYDAEYLKHFTCIDEVAIIPNICEYVGTVYSPTRPEYLIGPSRLSEGGKQIIEGEGGPSLSPNEQSQSYEVRYNTIALYALHIH